MIVGTLVGMQASSMARQQAEAARPISQRDFIIPTGHEAFVAAAGQAVFGIGRGLLTAALAGAAESGEGALLFSGSRAALRSGLSGGIEGISEGQATNLAGTMGKGAVQNVTITAGEDGAITAQMTRAGRNGYQVITKTIDADGNTTNVAQTAYDAAGKLVQREIWK